MSDQKKDLIEIEQFQIKTKKREASISKTTIISSIVIIFAVIIGFTIVCLVRFFA